MPISRKDIKEAVSKGIEPFAKAVQSDIHRLDNKFDYLAEELGEVKADVKWMKENTSELFAKLDHIIALFEKHEQEMVMISAQLRRLEERVTKLEAVKRGGK